MCMGFQLHCCDELECLGFSHGTQAQNDTAGGLGTAWANTGNAADNNLATFADVSMPYAANSVSDWLTVYDMSLAMPTTTDTQTIRMRIFGQVTGGMTDEAQPGDTAGFWFNVGDDPGRPVASKFFGFDQALLDFGSVYDFSTDGITILWNSNEKQLTGTEVNTTDFGGSLQFVKTGNGQPTVEISKVQVKVCYESVI